MGSFNFYNTEIEEVVLFDCFYSGDIRGGFTKSFEESLFKSKGINFNLSETFSSYSSN
ncbi:MAG: dTDP-4-dehydrorhamnose 3,5-epimerase family protein, partial [Odoribacter sp.]|nr:dTDP-4-dehydrorhamnose 3,5-epimerase family protein [Odoribacter sp.]